MAARVVIDTWPIGRSFAPYQRCSLRKLGRISSSNCGFGRPASAPSRFARRASSASRIPEGSPASAGAIAARQPLRRGGTSRSHSRKASPDKEDRRQAGTGSVRQARSERNPSSGRDRAPRPARPTTGLPRTECARPRAHAHSDDLAVARIEQRHRPAPEGRVLLAHSDDAAHPVEQRGAVAVLAFDVDRLIAVGRVHHDGQEQALRIGAREAGVAVGRPLHRRVRTPSRSPR